MSQRTRKKYGFLLLGLLLLVFGWSADRTAHYLSMHAPEPNAPWLIVEGWLPESVLPAVAAEYERGGYRRILVVGGPHDERVSQMVHNGKLTFVLAQARAVQSLTVEAYGTSGKGVYAHFEVWLNDTLRIGEAPTSGQMRSYRFALDSVVVHKVAVHYVNNHHPVSAGEDRDLLVRGIALDNEAIPALGSGAVYEYAFYDEYRREPQPATLAELTALRLGYLHIAETEIVPLPVADVGVFRTHAAAVRVRQWLDSAQAVGSANLCSMGFHARRSGWLYQRAWPMGSRLGVVNVRRIPPRWWLSARWVWALLRETAAWTITCTYFYCKEKFSRQPDKSCA